MMFPFPPPASRAAGATHGPDGEGRARSETRSGRLPREGSVAGSSSRRPSRSRSRGADGQPRTVSAAGSAGGQCSASRAESGGGREESVPAPVSRVGSQRGPSTGSVAGRASGPWDRSRSGQAG
jgi:hypothetical protein